jgi:hypothetical protein
MALIQKQGFALLLFLLLSFNACAVSEDVLNTNDPAMHVKIGVSPELDTCQVPEEIPEFDTIGNPHEVPLYIEMNFLDLLQNALMNGTEFEILNSITIDCLLTWEEAEIYLGEYMTGFNTEYRDTHYFMLADADNDGDNEIVVYAYGGGSGRFVDLHIFKLNDAGKYEKSYFHPFFGMLQEVRFVQYNGINYFITANINYTQKIRSGFGVYFFMDGMVYEAVHVERHLIMHFGLLFEPVYAVRNRVFTHGVNIDFMEFPNY